MQTFLPYSSFERYAEPVTAFEITYEVTSGDVADWVKELTTYDDGKYLTWDEWLQIRNRR